MNKDPVMPSVFDDLRTGLMQAIDFEKGVGEAMVTSYSSDAASAYLDYAGPARGLEWPRAVLGPSAKGAISMY